MSFVDELKGIQATEEDIKRKQAAQRKERQNKYINQILSLCRSEARNGKEWTLWHNVYEKAPSYLPEYGEGKFDRYDLVNELKKEEYGFTDVFARTLAYEGSDEYHLSIYVAWSEEGKRLANKHAKDSEPKEGCYIATAVYSSYDCPQVWTLRRYRDEVLATNRYGRAFIRVYYVISPMLVKWFGRSSWFKIMWKKPLDSLVAKLQLNGVKSTPYQDVNWRKNNRNV